MTIRPNPKRTRAAVFLLRGAELLLLASVLAADLAWLGYHWHHFAAVERADWIADYARIKELIETSYPNLDFAVTELRLDLRRLDVRASAQLEKAESAAEAEKILRDFVRAFHDGHLALRRPDTGTPAYEEPGVTVSASTSADDACRILGYTQSAERELDLRFRGPAVYQPLGGENAFPAGLLQLDGRQLGIVRIPIFDATEYGGRCSSAWEAFRQGLSTTCESACRGEFRDFMFESLLDDLGARIGAIRAAGAEALIVDVTGNPGGYTSFRVEAGALLAGRRLPEGPAVLAASEQTAAGLAIERRRLERALASCPGPPPARARLEAAYRRVDAAIAEASVPCDRSAVWSDWGARPDCAGFLAFEQFDADVETELESVDPGTAAWRRSAQPRTIPARPHWRGALLVLTDRNSASAAELLAGSLQDHAGAIVIGQRTSGCGGGWMFGQKSWSLDRTGLELCMPDHASVRADGASYQAGVVPDIAIPLDPRYGAADKASILVRGLREGSVLIR